MQLTDRFVRYARPKVIPAILGDCRNIMDSWGKSGSFDPFNTVYEVRVLSSVPTLVPHRGLLVLCLLCATSSPPIHSACSILLFPLMKIHMHDALHTIIITIIIAST